MLIAVVSRHSGSTKLEVMPGGGGCIGVVDRSIPEGREAILQVIGSFVYTDWQLTASCDKK